MLVSAIELRASISWRYNIQFRRVEFEEYIYVNEQKMREPRLMAFGNYLVLIEGGRLGMVERRFSGFKR